MLWHFHLAWPATATATVCGSHICSSHKLCLIMRHLSKDWPTPELNAERSAICPRQQQQQQQH